MKGNWVFYMLAWLVAVVTVAEADAQPGPYPDKPVQILADSSAGSTPDVALRIVADGLTQVWKQQVLVNNHPGAGGSLAVRMFLSMCRRTFYRSGSWRRTRCLSRLLHRSASRPCRS